MISSRMWKAGMVLALTGCAAAPPAPAAAPAPTCEPAETAPSAPTTPAGAITTETRDVPVKVAAAFEEDGSTCQPDTDDPAVRICDVKRQGAAALVITADATSLYFLSHFRRQPDKTCDVIVPELNQLNVQADMLKIVCNDEMVTFMSHVLLPTYGLSSDDLVQHGRRFQKAIGLLIQTGGMLAYLQ